MEGQANLCLTREPVNQISSRAADQARPIKPFHPVDKILFLPVRSTTQTEPATSLSIGWSRKAIRSPFGETRTKVIQPEVSYKTFPMGYSSRDCLPFT